MNSEPKRKGVKTFYPGKNTSPVTINLTDDSHAEMERVKACGASRGDVLEHSFRKLVGLPVNPVLEQALAALGSVAMQASS